MDDPRWLRVITVGLVLAALAVGYYILTGAFSINKTVNKTTPKTEATSSAVLATTISPRPLTPASPLAESREAARERSDGEQAKPTVKPVSAYEKIILRNKDIVQTLPKTGYPLGLAVLLSISAMISGVGLRKFPY